MKSEQPSLRSFKGVFVGINTIMGLIGLTCFAVGIYVRYAAQPTEADVRATTAVAYLLIFGGFFSILISLLGCLGAWLESNCILVLYFFITAAMFVLLIAVGIYSFRQVHTTAAEENKFVHSVKNYYKDQSAKEFVDKFHREMDCCGLTNPVEEFNGTVPTSCKTLEELGISEATPYNNTVTVASPKKVYRSCIDHGGSVRDYMATAGGLTLGFSVVVLLCIIAVIFLCSAMRNR